MQALGPATLVKTDFNTDVFLWNLQTFWSSFFCRTPPVAASENNVQQQLCERFANSCYKKVSPILLQELIKDFAVWKQCSGTLLLVEAVTSSHGFGN